MPINMNIGTIIEGGSSVKVTASFGGSILYEQNSDGIVTMPRTSGGATLIPLFNVGMGTDTWRNLGSYVTFNYTSGNGYVNISSCYNTSNSRFTAPWTGLYLFKQHVYIYGPANQTSTYTHPMFTVNGSGNFRRPGGTIYRMRMYGMPGGYGNDTDCCELIYLTAGDYVEVYLPANGQVQGYPPYSAWSGVYLGN